ncbi:MAG: BMP family ABC transporter substrate-binding protein [Clostridia bacterium]|nr:BMP family ABC transporter substrate-binding protein [Clostridia bacterium]
MKKFKRVFAVVLAVVMLMSLASCSFTEGTDTDITNDNIKIGVLLSGAKDSSTGMSGATMTAINELQSVGYGINDDKFRYAENIDPNNAEAAADGIQSLLNYECNLLICSDAAFLDDVEKMAADNESVKFLVFGAENDGQNIYGYNVNITGTSYLAGIVAGLKAAELKVPTLGYLAKSDADLSSLNAFAMGVKSVNAEAAVSAVIGTDAAAGVATLIKNGAVVIASDYEDEAISTACTDGKIFFCGFGSETYKDAETYLCAPVYNFTQFYIDAIKAIVDDKEPAEFTGGYATGATYLSDINEDNAAEGSQAAVDSAAQAIADGSLTFTISVDTPFENVTIVK